MPILIADEQLAAKLDRADGPLEICTRDGRRLGYFTPAKPAQYQLEPRVSGEELVRRLNEPGGYTAEEVAARMREWRCTPRSGRRPPSTSWPMPGSPPTPRPGT